MTPSDAASTNVAVEALENDASRFAHIRERLATFREMNDTQRADFAHWLWLCECESRAAAEKARVALEESGSRIGWLEAQVGSAEDAFTRIVRIANEASR